MDHQICQSYYMTYNLLSQMPYHSNSSNYAIANLSGYANLTSSQNVQKEGLIIENLLAHMGMLKYQLKCEQDARSEQAFQLKRVLQQQHNSLEYNKKLTDMLKSTMHELSELKLQLKSAKLEETTQLKAVLQNEKNLIAANRKLLAENAMLTESLKDNKIQLSSDKLKPQPQISRLKDNLSRADSELQQCQAQVNALTAINEMLIAGNEKRDERIADYKRKLQNYINLSPSLVSETVFADNAIAHISSPCTALGAENCLGTWLCASCGTNASTVHNQTYAEFRRRLCEVHKESIDLNL